MGTIPSIRPVFVRVLRFGSMRQLRAKTSIADAMTARQTSTVRMGCEVRTKSVDVTGRFSAIDCQSDGFGQVDRSSSGSLPYLLSAAESIRNNQRLKRGLPYGRQKHSLAQRLRNHIVVPRKAKCTGHSAAAGIDGVQIDPHFLKQ